MITQFGDGTGYKAIEILHSPTLHDPSGENRNGKAPEPDASRCVICTKTLVFLDNAKAHVAFEPSLRSTPYYEWSVRWRIDAADPKVYPQFAFPHESLSVQLTAEHKDGYGWGIGNLTALNILNTRFRSDVSKFRRLQSPPGFGCHDFRDLGAAKS
jgi:hypothetical protein